MNNTAMKAKHLDEIPETAGLAKLEFGDIAFPVRNGEKITLPKNVQSLDFYPLLGGEQFLVTTVAKDGDGGGRYFFGGTDESPFLVEINGSPVKAFFKEGEEGFFGVLKPKTIKVVEEKFGVKSKRQGDIFAAPLPYPCLSYTRGELKVRMRRSGLVGSSDWLLLEEHSLNGHSKLNRLFDTRHLLKGVLLYPDRRTRNKYGERVEIGQGTIQAEDHSSLDIRESPHILVQTRNLMNPAGTD